jgi:hypothetical protein
VTLRHPHAVFLGNKPRVADSYAWIPMVRKCPTVEMRSYMSIPMAPLGWQLHGQDVSCRASLQDKPGKTTISKAAISRAVISKAVMSRAMISKVVISKAAISRAVISKAVISKAAVGQDLGVQHVHDTRHATAVSRHLEPSTRTPARLVRSLEWRERKRHPTRTCLLLLAT